MKARIRRANPDIQLPVYSHPGSAAFDIASAEDVTIPAGQIARIKTGLFIEVPEGYFLGVFSRSSTPSKKGLSIPHGVGIIDPTFNGPEDELLIQVFNFTDKPVEVKSGERIAQGMFIQSPKVEWQEADQLAESSRGGFGSTGK